MATERSNSQENNGAFENCGEKENVERCFAWGCRGSERATRRWDERGTRREDRSGRGPVKITHMTAARAEILARSVRGRLSDGTHLGTVGPS